MPRDIVPNLWFDGNAEEAIAFYVSVFPGSRELSRSHYTEGSPGEAGSVMVVECELLGRRLIAINGGPQFTFSEAVSFLVECEDQEEIDHYWEVLSEGGEQGPCGWLKDRFGLSWQVAPLGMDEMLADPDPGRRQRAMQAMMGMRKIDLAALRAAADGEPVG